MKQPADVDLSITLCGVRLPNPFVLASGILGTSETLLEKAARLGAGAVTAKSAGLHPRAGHENPIVVDWGGGLINAVGLPNPGAHREAEVLAEAKARLAPLGVPLIASIFGGTPEEFAEVARIVLAARPDILEVNISCPNVHDEYGEPFAASCAGAVSVVEAVRPLCPIPLFVKLAPNVPNVGRIAADVVAAGADGITAINTMPGMVIDVESGRPVLTNRSGGLSGPALKPIAVRCVYEIAQAVPDVPIIGTGGVTTGNDAAEMIMAGATAVGVGSAVYYRGLDLFRPLCEELAAVVRHHGAKRVEQLRGLAHRSHGVPWKENKL
ncbi:MAG: dihydroorotate dehydrogenase [Ardenticatenia bacterium]|nr:dihydroorotate dehydrogenase [Ardenticatenia bacterium]